MSDFRRYADYNKQLMNSNKFSNEEKQEKLENQLVAIKKANVDYRTTANAYNEKVDELALKLDPKPSMQKCQDTILAENNRMASTANELIDLPNQMCDQFTAAYTTFVGELEKAYALIGAPIPR